MQAQKAIIETYLGKQRHALSSVSVNCMLAHEAQKFEMAVLKAHFQRISNAAQPTRDFVAGVQRIMHWESPVKSAAANVAWISFCYAPLEVSRPFPVWMISCGVLEAQAEVLHAGVHRFQNPW